MSHEELDNIVQLADLAVQPSILGDIADNAGLLVDVSQLLLQQLMLLLGSGYGVFEHQLGNAAAFNRMVNRDV
jgi:hypothetical protein